MGKKHNKQQPDEKQIKEEELTRLAKKLHIGLFPEEYDHMYDSISEANDRRRGINPMSADYIAATNKRRAQLGFSPFGGGSHSTYQWVLEKLRAGEEDSLVAIKANRDEEDAKAKQECEEQRAQLQTETWKNQKIDAMLASDSFVGFNEDRDDPNVVAFRVLGEIFGMNLDSLSESHFNTQIRRVIPGKTEDEYKKLFEHALDKWTEVYGY